MTKPSLLVLSVLLLYPLAGDTAPLDPARELPFYFPPAWTPREVDYMRGQLANAGHRVEMINGRYAVVVSRDRYPAFFRYSSPDGPVKPSAYPSQYLPQQVYGQGVTQPPIRSQSYGYFTTSPDTRTNGHANWGYNRPGLRSLSVYSASDLDIPGTFGEIDQETLLGYRRGAFPRGDYSVVVRTPRPGVPTLLDRLIGRPSSPDPLPRFRMQRDWGRFGTGLEQTGSGAFVAVAGAEEVINALINAPDDPYAFIVAGGGAAAATVGTSAALFGTANIAGGLGLGGAAGGLSAGGAAVGAVVLPAAAVGATAAGGIYVGHQLDNSTGGRVSDGAATAACAIGDTVANICYRWWGSEWNYSMTRESASMFGTSRRSGTCP